MNTTLLHEINHKIDFKTKPLGSLGELEDLARKICQVQETTSPQLQHPHIVVFAGDHGITKAGVSPYPQEVTAQMVLNFVNGGAAINVFCRQHDIDLKVVDAGVNYNFDPGVAILHEKVGKGTKNFLDKPAMTASELKLCMDRGSQIVKEIASSGCNIIGFGEMGIGNTTPAALIMHKLLDLPVAYCVGRGAGISDEGLKVKLEIIKKAANTYYEINDTLTIMQTFMGYEMAMMCGAFLEAAAQKMLVLVDGFISSSVFLCAHKINPAILNNAIFCHQSNEKGHKIMLEHFAATPILKLNMRLGEGTGCALAYPIIQSAVRFMNEMASFDSAGVSNKS